MRRLAYFITLTLVLVSCGSRKGTFSLDGRLLNLNQGEFYVYSPDGVFDGIDTIRVDGGRFAYTTSCRREGTIYIVFPNYSEQPVFVTPGKTVTINGDASHLKEIEVTGTDENKLMNSFRKKLAKASPKEESEIAERFIRDNAKSPVSVYILRKYFVTNVESDVSKAVELAAILHEKQPRNGEVAKMSRYLQAMKKGGVGASVPSFSEKDIHGDVATDACLRGKVAVVYTWSSWDSGSKGLRKRLETLSREYGDRLALLGISLDASVENCKRELKNDTLSIVNICDQRMFDSPLLEKFALVGVSDNIIFNARGKAIERGLDADELERKIKTLLN